MGEGQCMKMTEVIGVERVEEMLGTSGADGLEDDVRLMQDVATVDLGHLAVLDPTPIDAARFRNQPEIFIKSHTSAAVQLLLRQLQTLPQQKDRLGVVVELPKPQTVLPREKPVPKPKPLTRWQKFAQEKGITKQKRSKMVWDE